MADAIFTAIGKSFTNSERIMHWLIDCTRLTCKLLNRSVFWVSYVELDFGENAEKIQYSPLGLPVIQPYVRSEGIYLVPEVKSKKKSKENETAEQQSESEESSVIFV